MISAPGCDIILRMTSKDDRIARELTAFEPQPPEAATISPRSAAAADPDIFTAGVLLVMPIQLWRELEKQAAQAGRPIAELARVACSMTDGELDGLNPWAWSTRNNRTHKFLIRMTREHADRLKRQAARLGYSRATVMRACIAAHLHAQPDLPIE